MQPIKIVHVHNYYQHAGGEDKVVGQEIELLRTMGHQVIPYRKHNDEIKRMSLGGKLLAPWRTIWSLRSYREMKRFLSLHKPDIVHFHNTFPLISPSAYYAAKKLGLPVVQTLHNYRLLCPAGAFFQNGAVCEKCAEQTLLHAVTKGCYRESRLQSAVVAAMLAVNRRIRTWERKVDRYIVLTEFARDKFVQNGLPADKIAVKANFTQSSGEEAPKKAFFLYVGRLSREKGADTLIDNWRDMDPSKQLIVIGDGPDELRLRRQARHMPNIVFLGNQDSSVVMQHMREARFLIVPSICYEGFPMTVIEAYSVGTPVLCNCIGSLAEIVEDGVTGFHYEVGDRTQLPAVIRKAEEEGVYELLQRNVRFVYRTRYDKTLNASRLVQIYEQLLQPASNPEEAEERAGGQLAGGYVLESEITALSLGDTAAEIERWIGEGTPNYVCVCTTHSLVTATERDDFKRALAQAGICTPDGMPLVWALRALGYRGQERVDGTTLTKELCRRASKRGYRIYLYGCTDKTLSVLRSKLEREYPGISIVGTASPPFRALTEEEERAYVDGINACDPDLVFVALGCPKQEVWMNRHRHRIQGVMLGVGAAFDYLAGNITRPPVFLQRLGLEWLFRLLMEPRRLWKRYAYHNSKFIYRYFLSFRRNKLKTRKLEA
jgi:exopolysaccharide biosynthesis WecB/TagA/CpsF family protein